MNLNHPDLFYYTINQDIISVQMSYNLVHFKRKKEINLSTSKSEWETTLKSHGRGKQESSCKIAQHRNCWTRLHTIRESFPPRLKVILFYNAQIRLVLFLDS